MKAAVMEAFGAPLDIETERRVQPRAGFTRAACPYPSEALPESSTGLSRRGIF